MCWRAKGGCDSTRDETFRMAFRKWSLTSATWVGFHLLSMLRIHSLRVCIHLFCVLFRLLFCVYSYLIFRLRCDWDTEFCESLSCWYVSLRSVLCWISCWLWGDFLEPGYFPVLCYHGTDITNFPSIYQKGLLVAGSDSGISVSFTAFINC
jgi:hypothetical protein